VCLEIMQERAELPCGHMLCVACLRTCWDVEQRALATWKNKCLTVMCIRGGGKSKRERGSGNERQLRHRGPEKTQKRPGRRVAGAHTRARTHTHAHTHARTKTQTHTQCPLCRESHALAAGIEELLSSNRGVAGSAKTRCRGSGFETLSVLELRVVSSMIGLHIPSIPGVCVSVCVCVCVCCLRGCVSVCACVCPFKSVDLCVFVCE
jgi:hypothetical protein